jgi:membrane-bound lytic murein transglycosylase F
LRQKSSHLENFYFCKINRLKKRTIIFLIISLLALSLGVEFYFFDAADLPILKKLPLLHKHSKIEMVIPQINSERDLDVIRTLLLFHAADYFVYRGAPIGFQYEMLKNMELGLGRNIDIKIETDAGRMQKELYGNNYDVVIMDFIHNGFLLPFLERSIPHSYSYPVLVSANYSDSIDSKTIMVSSDFPAKLFFKQDSPYHHFQIEKNDLHSTEELFEMVANEIVPYLICDFNQAITLISFYPNVQILDKAGPQFERRWFLNKKNAQLNDEINHWLLDFKKTGTYRSLIKTYFSPESALISSLPVRKRSGISEYDAIIKKYARQYNFDWRFVASIIYQETNFTPGLTGKGGSYGLMQLMPTTMEQHGISEEDSDEANILAGIQHLHLIRKSFDEIGDEDEKLYFVAASYNAGRGHIFDAQRLSIKNETDPNKWENASKYLILKSQSEFATDSVVKWGYFPGAHTVRYANQVMERYKVYRLAYPR